MSLLVRGARVGTGSRPIDVRAEGGAIAAIAPRLAPRPGEEVIDAAGAELLPGLADHHVHLLAWAAALDSVSCGPPTVSRRDELAAAVRDAAPTHDLWIRGVGYHESVAGLLDRDAIDEFETSRPVRIQHRSGMLWMLNSAALRSVGAEYSGTPPGVERDGRGRPTGRCWDLDGWLRDRLPRRQPDLGRVGRKLAAWGVTAVTDATVSTDRDALSDLGRAVTMGALPLRVTAMGPVDLGVPESSPIRLGPVKILLREAALPNLDHITDRVAAARALGRPVAFHCTTRAELVFALAALDDAPSGTGDRIEHGGVVPAELYTQLRALGLTVVTQPNFVAERGDEYLDSVDPADLPHLYPCASLRDAGVRVAGGTDAPFGDGNPWRAIDAAQHRRTRAGQLLGAGERIDSDAALGLFLGPSHDPDGPRRRVAIGDPADLCLVDRCGGTSEARDSTTAVLATIVAGRAVYRT